MPHNRPGADPNASLANRQLPPPPLGSEPRVESNFENITCPFDSSSDSSGFVTLKLSLASQRDAPTINNTGRLQATFQAFKNGGFLAGAHLTRQIAGTGIPYFARELVAYGVYELLKKHSGICAGLQTGLVFAGMAAQIVRITKDQRKPEEAARASTGVSSQQWAAMTPTAQQHRIRAHQVMSAIQMAMQVAGSSMNFAMAVEGYLAGKPTQSAMALATELKSMVFCVLRDTSQASFSMVGAHETTPEILGPAPMALAAVVYGCAQGLLGLAGDAARSKRTFSTKSVFEVKKKSGFSAFAAVLATAGVKAAINTLIEGIDDGTQSTLKACKWGAKTRVNPQFQFPPPDGARLLDQTPARHAFVNLFLAGLNLVDSRLEARQTSNKTRVLIGNGAAAVFGAALYPSTVSLWQGSAAVREQLRKNSDILGLT
jgi:hypothetical protein